MLITTEWIVLAVVLVLLLIVGPEWDVRKLNPFRKNELPKGSSRKSQKQKHKLNREY